MQPQYITLKGRAINIAGQRFGRLVALGPVGRNRRNKIMWLCRCDCGNMITVGGYNLRSGRTRSCCCLMKEFASTVRKTHGMSKDPLYSVWRDMIRRCVNPDYKNYNNYGGRGIGVCDEWLASFPAFRHYAIQLSHCSETGFSLDRIDNEAGYFPGNIRFATNSEQLRNRRINHMITHNGKTQCLFDWAHELHIHTSTLRYRLSHGWSVTDALTLPIDKTRSRAKSK